MNNPAEMHCFFKSYMKDYTPPMVNFNLGYVKKLLSGQKKLYLESEVSHFRHFEYFEEITT